MTQVIELIKWCFKDTNSSVCTIIVIAVIFGGIAKIIEDIKN